MKTKRIQRAVLLIVGILLISIVVAAAPKKLKITREAKGREGPGIYFKLVILIPRDTSVDLIETKENWHKVKYKEQEVWVSANAVEQAKASAAADIFGGGDFSEVTAGASPAVLTAAIKGFWTRYSRTTEKLYELPVEGYEISVPGYQRFSSERAKAVDRIKLMRRYKLEDRDKKHDIPYEKEHSVGFACASKAAVAPPMSSEKLNNYIHDVAWYLAEATERYDIRYRLYVLDTDRINAISCPGGYIVLTRGLLDLLGDESELAALLAHEMAHIIAGHGMLQAMDDKVRLKADSAFGALDKQVGSTETEAELVGITDRAMSVALAPKLDEYEFEADEMALNYLARSGYDLGGLSRLLDKLKAQHDKTTDIFDLNYRNHPDFGKRMKRIEKEVKSYKRYDGRRFDSEFAANIAL